MSVGCRGGWFVEPPRHRWTGMPHPISLLPWHHICGSGATWQMGWLSISLNQKTPQPTHQNEKGSITRLCAVPLMVPGWESGEPDDPSQAGWYGVRLHHPWTLWQQRSIGYRALMMDSLKTHLVPLVRCSSLLLHLPWQWKLILCGWSISGQASLGEFSGSCQEGLHLFTKRTSAEEVLPEGSFSTVQDWSSWVVTTLAARSVVIQSHWSAGHVLCGQERL